MNIFEKTSMIITKPQEFFTNLNEKSLIPAWLFYLVYNSIYIVIIGILVILFAGLFAIINESIPGSSLSAELVPVFIGLGILAILILFAFGIFVSAAITHVLLLFYKLKGGYNQTFQVLVYASVPSLIISIITFPLQFIPFVGGLLSFILFPVTLAAFGYSIYLQIYGLAKVHNISYLKAATPLLILIALGFIAIIVFMALLFLGIFTSIIS